MNKVFLGKEKIYEFYGIELTPIVMKELLIKLYDGKQFKRSDAVKNIINYHDKNGGLVSKIEYMSTFKKATNYLKNNGLVNCGYGTWRLNYIKQEIQVIEPNTTNYVSYKVDEKFGIGKEAIYVYYYDVYKNYANLSGEKYFPCKIGRTDKKPLERIFSQCGTCYPEFPRVAMIIYCEDAIKLENALHGILKFQNKWIKDSPGTEWFYTNPEEIKKIYNSLNE